MKQLSKTNPRLSKLIFDLKAQSRQHNVAFWRDIAERIEKPARNYPEVNLSKINRYSTENEIVIIPGKVLGSGNLDHPVTVVALNFSLTAEDIIMKANGKCMTIEQLMESNPTGKGVRILA